MEINIQLKVVFFIPSTRRRSQDCDGSKCYQAVCGGRQIEIQKGSSRPVGGGWVGAGERIMGRHWPHLSVPDQTGLIQIQRCGHDKESNNYNNNKYLLTNFSWKRLGGPFHNVLFNFKSSFLYWLCEINPDIICIKYWTNVCRCRATVTNEGASSVSCLTKEGKIQKLINFAGIFVKL